MFLSPENSESHLSYFALFVRPYLQACGVLDTFFVSFVFLFLFCFLFCSVICILFWSIMCGCVCHQRQILFKADFCLNVYPCDKILSYLFHMRARACVCVCVCDGWG